MFMYKLIAIRLFRTCTFRTFVSSRCKLMFLAFVILQSLLAGAPGLDFETWDSTT